MGKDLNGKELGQGISQRKNGTYYARYVDRFGKRVSIYNPNLQQLRRELAKAIYKNEIKANNFDDNIILDDWYEKWMDIYKADEIRESSKRIYNHIYKTHISPILGNKKLSKITNLHIKDLLNKLKLEKGLGYEVRNKSRIILQDMFDKAIMNELMLRNPAKGIKIIRGEKKSVQVLSVEDQYDFLNCSAGTFYHNMFEVHISSGLRPGELYALREKDLDFINNTITVSRTLTYQKFDGDDKKTFHLGPPKTEQSNRVIPMSQKCKLALQRQILQKRIIMAKTAKKVPEEFQDLLFTTKYGTPLNVVIYGDAIKKIINEINLCRMPIDAMEYFSPHCFRHTFATRCFESGIDFKIIQKHLGHATLQMTTDLYVHVTDTIACDSLPKLDKKLLDIDNMGEELTIKRIQAFNESQCKVIEFSKYTA